MTVLYEVNTAVWLGELSGLYGRRVTLGDVPGEAWNEIALPGIDTVWPGGRRPWHEGQFEGRRVRPPVFLARRPQEPVDEPLRAFHHRLLTAAAAVRRGAWRPLVPTGWPDNDTHRNLLAWTWTHADVRHLVVVNHSDRPAQARLPLPWDDLPGLEHRLTDLLTSQAYDRDGGELADPGLFVALEAWQTHVFEVG
ncbi:hypothetical protein ACIRPU_06565 [Streptomyces sp. NPDC102259]|uniref:hypothetical protein n=1 Tax=Streptomyces sp. NPDC102259 TaxID=3366148 RepID=UPI0038060670